MKVSPTDPLSVVAAPEVCQVHDQWWQTRTDESWDTFMGFNWPTVIETDGFTVRVKLRQKTIVVIYNNSEVTDQSKHWNYWTYYLKKPLLSVDTDIPWSVV